MQPLVTVRDVSSVLGVRTGPLLPCAPEAEPVSEPWWEHPHAGRSQDHPHWMTPAMTAWSYSSRVVGRRCAVVVSVAGSWVAW